MTDKLRPSPLLLRGRLLELAQSRARDPVSVTIPAVKIELLREVTGYSDVLEALEILLEAAVARHVWRRFFERDADRLVDLEGLPEAPDGR